ncbi:cancer-related nucleoside-triphosphatase homolog isoform X2 [Amphiura filiformis]|uniref:cancer-related nucleoside-triphosphatase homolog isoform X2 n=1 Tax=Amphiura filiformis TaxID=82378 RepID=UPI003B20DEE1
MAAAAVTARHIFVTGQPGVGKTTLVMQTVEQLKASGVEVHGFYTEEVRDGGRRIGFDVVTMDGMRGPLARVSSSGGPRVGQYAVNLRSFEQLALPRVEPKSGSRGTLPVYVIDEVGKMELFSQGFVQSVRRLLNQPYSTVLGTIPVPKGKTLGLVEEIRSRRDVKVYNLTKDLRNQLVSEVVEAVQKSHQQPK